MARDRYEQICEDFRHDAQGRLGGLRERVFQKIEPFKARQHQPA